MTDRLLGAAVSTLEKRTSRRGFLVRFAMVGTALTVAPLRYLLRPGTAWAVSTCTKGARLCGSGCNNGHCGDGYTTFCCTISSAGNFCPSNTYIGGWWYCCPYTGTKLCGGTNIRYYVDCNLLPSSSCTPQCALGTCVNRSWCCVCFKYGNCNTGVYPYTPVYCRIIRCSNPGTLFSSCSIHATYDSTCSHEATCLPAAGTSNPQPCPAPNNI